MAKLIFVKESELIEEQSPRQELIQLESGQRWRSEDPDIWMHMLNAQKQHLAYTGAMRKAAFEKLFNLTRELITELEWFDPTNVQLASLKKSLEDWEKRIANGPHQAEAIFPFWNR